MLQTQVEEPREGDWYTTVRPRVGGSVPDEEDYVFTRHSVMVLPEAFEFAQARLEELRKSGMPGRGVAAVEQQMFAALAGASMRMARKSGGWAHLDASEQLAILSIRVRHAEMEVWHALEHPEDSYSGILGPYTDAGSE